MSRLSELISNAKNASERPTISSFDYFQRRMGPTLGRELCERAGIGQWEHYEVRHLLVALLLEGVSCLD